VRVIEWGNWYQAAFLTTGGVDEEEVMLENLGSRVIHFNL
jgi:hypothetical protein